MQDIFARSRVLIGQEKLDCLQRAHVAVLGLGGVGGICAETLLRSGVGELTLIDGDTVSLSNINRQVVATCADVDKPKASVMRGRLLSIIPSARINAHQIFLTPDNIPAYIKDSLSYVVDAVDNVTAKLAVAVHCYAHGIPLISAMGAGNKLDMRGLKIADLFETDTDPLCRVMRRELRKKGVGRLQVAYSTEPPAQHGGESGLSSNTPASMPFVPNAMGLLLAQTVATQLWE